ncbi:hypothetical protein P4O66_010431 [Electrophorus voltai]|uniref:Uncharacterized protein n=1 Tax=Electrophorus voltai TaxID=2609070 RepID=A0AAD8ZC11_9TELE|nr:hypothetical protein P4O66_010431 [Electrophorus voltai]
MVDGIDANRKKASNPHGFAAAADAFLPGSASQPPAMSEVFNFTERMNWTIRLTFGEAPSQGTCVPVSGPVPAWRQGLSAKSSPQRLTIKMAGASEYTLSEAYANVDGG